MRSLYLALAALPLLVTPALAQQPTARASGNIPVYAEPNSRTQLLGYLADGQEVTLQYCTQNDDEWDDDDDRPRRRSSFPLFPAGTTQWCLVTDTGWVRRNSLVGSAAKRLVTPPDFSGPGW